MRRIGVEEELWVVHPGTRRAAPRAPEVLAGTSADAELFRHQVEVQSRPATDVADVVAELHGHRRDVLDRAAQVGLAVAASGVVVLPSADHEVSDDDRYRDMLRRYGPVAEGGGTCGMHVHVEVADAEEGVRVLDAIAPWLPVLLAASANSPYAGGTETGYASWRSELWSRWPSAGPTEPFGGEAGYRAAGAALVASGAARDAGMLYFDARLAEQQPTVEVRVCDVVTDLADVAVLAALVRALVDTAARGCLASPPWRTELLRAARWRAAHDGLCGSLLHPAFPGSRPFGAAEVLRDLVDSTSRALEEAGDRALVERGVERLLAATGAVRQRASYGRRGSLEDVVDDLVRRTAAPA
ncbi:carboxylate-amine ligase [Nocardioides litoris]|uniref:carboxylate-amine ligase n=1 Tax=Nocardioides litoris TaxID=1926648 RepID=UPI00111F4307|nr:glutamate--cysteine ligase [Nocardioides litoris]